MKLFLAIATALMLTHSAHAQCGPNGCYQQTTVYPGGWHRVGTVTGPLGVMNYPVVQLQPSVSVTQSFQALPPLMPGYVRVSTWTGNGWRHDGDFPDAPREAVRESRVYAPSPYQSSQRCQCGCGCVNCRCGR